jgi:hypothetical protein
MNTTPLRDVAHAVAMTALLFMRPVAADPAPFDLVGPTLQVSVTRGGATLPITQVPSLATADQLVVRAELPADQSARYLMVAAFLRGPTNPPPTDWFYRCDTWTRACRESGLALTVPAGASQLLVLFAPQTGGDFKTLVGAIQGRPGAFVRAAQELNQATLDRARLEEYLRALRELGATDPSKVRETAPLLARSLAIKVDEKCLDRMPALQAPCLMQNQESLILSDGHDASMVANLTSGPASDLAIQAGNTALMNSGAYVPYIGSVLDIARLMDSFHTARYQYIPALTSPRQGSLVLMLNTPPSFHDPKSVLVAALPAIEPAQPPALRSVDPKGVSCAQRNPLPLSIDGAPLLFATEYARELTLAVHLRDGTQRALPAHPDARTGGVVVDTSALQGAEIDERRGAVLGGRWGFDRLDGPSFQLANAPAQAWSIAPGDESALVVGREDVLHLTGTGSACLEEIRLRDTSGEESKLPWTIAKADRIELKVPLANSHPGERTLLVRQYGARDPQQIRVNTFADVGRLDAFVLHAGDAEATLKGTRLDEVVALNFRDLDFAPGPMTTTAGTDELRLLARDAHAAAALKAGDTGKVTIRLKDGRTLLLDAAAAPARPRRALIARNVLYAPDAGGAAITLASATELPVSARFNFAVRALAPATFSRDEEIEVASVDGSFSTTLSVRRGGVTLENSKVAIATLDPGAAFGPSAFGPVQFRVLAGGVASDWQPLGVLVRLPQLAEVACAAEAEGACELKGTHLYLIAAVATDRQFAAPVAVAEGFAGDAFPVPRPVDGQLYLRLRDDPTVVNVARVPIIAPPHAPDAPVVAPELPAAASAAQSVPASTAADPQVPLPH